MKKAMMALVMMVAGVAVSAPVKSNVAGNEVGRSGAPLPYDAEVEWIAANSSSPYTIPYLKIDVIAYNTDIVFIDGYITVNNKELFSFDLLRNRQFNIETGATYYRWWTGNPINIGGGILNTRHLYECSSTIFVDGVAKGSRTPTEQSHSSSLYVFNGFHGTTNGRIYALRLTDNFGQDKINAKPVRFTNENGVSEGAMYDRVTGELFRNAGTGAFLVGPDKR